MQQITTAGEARALIRELEQFFSNNINKVNKLVYLMAYDPTNRREWMRDVWNLEQLPRYDANEKMTFLAPHPWVSVYDVAMRMHSVVEFGLGKWRYDRDGFWFSLQEDAAIYRLHWPDDPYISTWNDKPPASSSE